MSTRVIYLLGLFSIIVLIAISLYLQFEVGIMPCPLCSLQRVTFGVLGIVLLVGLFVAHRFIGRILINSAIIILSLLGMGLAGRQIWLQHFPQAADGECGVSLQYMLQVLPLNEVMQKVFAGSAECTQIGWEFIHLNMAEWAFLWFSLYLLVALYLFLRELQWKTDPQF